MKIKIITLCLFLMPLFLIGQSKSSFDIIGGVDYAYRTLSSNNDTLSQIGTRNANEKGRVKARFGFNYNKKLKERLFFKTGVRLASVGYVVSDIDNLIFGSDLDILEGSNGTANSMDNGSFKSIEDNYFIEIPLMLRHELSAKKFSLFVDVGLSPNIYLSTRVKQIFRGETTTQIIDSDTFDYSRLNLVGSLSLGMNYIMNDKWQFFAQSIGRYHFTPLISDAQIRENLYTIGLELGVRKMLK